MKWVLVVRWLAAVALRGPVLFEWSRQRRGNWNYGGCCPRKPRINSLFARKGEIHSLAWVHSFGGGGWMGVDQRRWWLFPVGNHYTVGKTTTTDGRGRWGKWSKVIEMVLQGVREDWGGGMGVNDWIAMRLFCDYLVKDFVSLRGGVLLNVGELKTLIRWLATEVWLSRRRATFPTRMRDIKEEEIDAAHQAHTLGILFKILQQLIMMAFRQQYECIFQGSMEEEPLIFFLLTLLIWLAGWLAVYPSRAILLVY